jgi:thiamine-phosphate diphosphorylase/hydroxyethylthiazole kinase
MQVLSRGVDAVGSGFSNPAGIVKALARTRGVSEPWKHGPSLILAAAIVVLTGVEDYISDGEVVLKGSNGHELVNPTKSGIAPY